MKNSYDRKIQLRCNVCGGTNFEFNEDKTWVKCNRCEKEYPGGYDELVELNSYNINEEVENLKNELQEDLKRDITDMLKDAFKGFK